MASIGVDIGGTFTDVVAVDPDGTMRIAKLPSTRSDPSRAVHAVLADLLPAWKLAPADVDRFVHGTTVATNAVLERKGARLGLLTTAGFEDVLEIGRQNRRQIYDLLLKPETPGFLAPGIRRKGVVESIGPDGSVAQPIDTESLKTAVDALVAEGVEAIAISFLFSFANPAHERAAAEFIREHHPGMVLSLSSDVDPAFREYERSVVTAFDAYVKPGLDRYLAAMEDDLATAGVPAQLQIMQSRGGVCSARVARTKPIRLFLSGPAAGVVGARAVGQSVGIENLITVDIGGTSSDIALISRGEAMLRPEGLLDGFRIRVPMVDVNSIGAGGGSIAWIDAGGGLRVGPQSAGAEPGPACYGRGGENATVTDASIVLGLLDPAFFAGGTLKLNPKLAAQAIETKVARPLGLTLHQAALGIHRVVNAQMAEGIRLVSISRGVDPRGFALMPFGGGGALHATALARELGIHRIVVPRYPGVLCASGLLSAHTEHEASIAYIRPLASADTQDILRVFDDLGKDCAARMRKEGVAENAVATHCFADVCYIGQAHHLEVPLDRADPARMLERLYEDFRVAHDRIYGHSTRSAARLVNLRVVQSAVNSVPAEPPPTEKREASRKGNRDILLEGASGFVSAAVYDRDALAAGQTVAGPAIVEQSDTTTLIEPGWVATTAANGVLIINREASI